jgi:hypothetical protein
MLIGAIVVTAGLAAGSAADTLVLRSGRRIEGTLVSVRGDSVEFVEERGGRRTQRYDRSEVRRIELDDDGYGGSGSWTDRRDDRRDDASRSAGMRERQVTVEAANSWTDTGIDVRRGQELRFEAAGRVRWGADRRDGPAGEGGSHNNPKRPMPNRPGGALIGRVGRVGEGNDFFFIGQDVEPIRVRSNGRLYLGVNDDYLQDNSGSFRVVVYY